MNNVYRDVQSVVARVRGAGGRPRARSALLLNCHFDTVPDSPGERSHVTLNSEVFLLALLLFYVPTYGAQWDEIDAPWALK